jgi:hypothetical protein
MERRLEVRRGSAIALAALCAGAVYFVAVWVQQSRPTTAGIGFDLYNHYWGNTLYFVRSLHEGLGGLLWNPYQACGKAGSPSARTASSRIARPGPSRWTSGRSARPGEPARVARRGTAW